MLSTEMENDRDRKRVENRETQTVGRGQAGRDGQVGRGQTNLESCLALGRRELEFRNDNVSGKTGHLSLPKTFMEHLNNYEVIYFRHFK